MGRTANLLIAGETGLTGPMAQQLNELGFRTGECTLNQAVTELTGHRYDALVSFGHVSHELTPPGIIHVHVGSADDGLVDARMRPPAHAIQVAARVRSLLRLSVIERVSALRTEDVKNHATSLRERPAGPDRPAILYVGRPDPVFMRLQHALRRENVDTVGAFSTFNAFDYLHERPFDAVVLHTQPEPDLAHTVCSAMRRNTRLYHTPALLITRSEVYAEADEAFARGASDIIPSNASSDELRDRVCALADERRRRREAKAGLESCLISDVLDPGHDLYSLNFGRAHLQSLLSSAQQLGNTLSLVVLQAQLPPTAGMPGSEHANHAMSQFAGMLRHCVRAEDFAMRAGPDMFCLVLPNTAAEEAKVVANRVAAIAECTAYEGSDPLQPFRINLSSEVCQASPDDQADTFLTRAIQSLERKTVPLAAS